MEKAVVIMPDITLGKGSFSDWEALWRNIWSFPESARYMQWEPTHSAEAAQARMERTLRWQASHPAFTIYENATGQAIGFAGLLEHKPGLYMDTGLALGPAYTGRGYGRQALRALMQVAFEQLGAQKLDCCCRTENAPSRWLQLNCGLRYSHTEPSIDPHTGAPCEIEFYAMTREEYFSKL